MKKARNLLVAEKKAIVRGDNGQELHDQLAIREACLQYVEQHTQKKLGQTIRGETDLPEMESGILKKEVVWALNQLPNPKAPEVDGILADLLRTLPTKALTMLCQSVWMSDQWPKEWKRSTFISISKKGDMKDYSNH